MGSKCHAMIFFIQEMRSKCLAMSFFISKCVQNALQLVSVFQKVIFKLLGVTRILLPRMLMQCAKYRPETLDQKSRYLSYFHTTVVTNIKRNDCRRLHNAISISQKERRRKLFRFNWLPPYLYQF